MSTAPVLTDAQRKLAYDRSLEVRQARSLLKAWLKLCEPSRRECLAMALSMDCAQGMKVRNLLTAMDGIGFLKADNLMAKAGIHKDKTVRACGPRQLERLLDLL